LRRRAHWLSREARFLSSLTVMVGIVIPHYYAPRAGQCQRSMSSQAILSGGYLCCPSIETIVPQMSGFSLRWNPKCVAGTSAGTLVRRHKNHNVDSLRDAWPMTFRLCTDVHSRTSCRNTGYGAAISCGWLSIMSLRQVRRAILPGFWVQRDRHRLSPQSRRHRSQPSGMTKS
jgi:hypothetical protein